MYRPARGIRLQGFALTDTGKVRNNNEDNVYLWNNENLMLAIVADGMGGAAAGEEASRIAVQTIEDGLFSDRTDVERKQLYDSATAETLSDKLREVIRSANTNIVQQAFDSPDLRGMGTTITMALVRDTYAVIGHVGDSRAYLVDGSDGNISQITSDHSFVEAMVAAGHISREEAEDHPMRNVLYRALGQGDEVDVDVYHSYLRVGDRLVLCSDGLTLHVTPEEIAKMTLGEHDMAHVSQQLVDLANSRGGRDNISVVVALVTEDDMPVPVDKEATQIKKPSPSDDDTLILRDRDNRPFVSSESSSAPRSEPQDSLLTRRTVTRETFRVEISQNGAEPAPVPVKECEEDQFGEGRDSLKPDV